METDMIRGGPRRRRVAAPVLPVVQFLFVFLRGLRVLGGENSFVFFCFFFVVPGELRG